MKFNKWSAEALRGYIITMDEFLSGSMYEESQQQRKLCADRLDAARLELAGRSAPLAGRRTLVAFPDDSDQREG